MNLPLGAEVRRRDREELVAVGLRDLREADEAVGEAHEVPAEKMIEKAPGSIRKICLLNLIFYNFCNMSKKFRARCGFCIE